MHYFRWLPARKGALLVKTVCDAPLYSSKSVYGPGRRMQDGDMCPLPHGVFKKTTISILDITCIMGVLRYTKHPPVHQSPHPNSSSPLLGTDSILLCRKFDLLRTCIVQLGRYPTQEPLSDKGCGGGSRPSWLLDHDTTWGGSKLPPSPNPGYPL